MHSRDLIGLPMYSTATRRPLGETLPMSGPLPIDASRVFLPLCRIPQYSVLSMVVEGPELFLTEVYSLPFEETATILVGKDEVAFTVHTALFRQRSKFWKAALSEKWKKNKEVIRLPLEVPRHFSQYMSCVHHQKATPDDGDVDDDLRELAALYLLADSKESFSNAFDRDLATAGMKLLDDCFDNDREVFSALATAHKNEHYGSCRFHVHDQNFNPECPGR
nr:hypothetical protein CFP56_13243 [Quercus suber]